MHETIKSLWMGELHPGDRFFRKDSPYHSLSAKKMELTNKLLETLSDSEKKIFENIMDVTDEMNIISEEDVFITAFQLGAKLILETVTEYNSQFHS